MENKPIILLVEDDAFSADFAAEILSVDYEVRHVDNGAAALAAMAKGDVSLVLLDIELPAMNGYQVCQAIRDDSATADVPVIFLSSKVSDAERLAGYDAGGDDYLTKPISAEELRSKIRFALARFHEKQRLKRDLSGAFSTAMTAMTSAAEIGAVLQFLRSSFNCPDYPSLCQEIIKTMASYGLEASVKIHGKQGSVAFSPSGECSPLEDSVLSNLSKQGRMFEFGARTSCSYPHITMIIKNVARDDPDRHGRMKDNLACLAEGADARIVALDAGATVTKQHAVLSDLALSTRQALQTIDQRHRQQAIANNQIFENLRKNFDRSMLTIGLTSSQEEELESHLNGAASQARALYDEGLEISQRLDNILKQLETAVQ